MSRQVRIATRRSRLALWQAEHVAARLAALHPDLVVSLVPIVTEGDRIQDRSLAAVGGKGLFIKELENAMREGLADIAVHSMKDVPGALPRVIRVLIHWYGAAEHEPQHVYLGEAAALRLDLTGAQ